MKEYAIQYYVKGSEYLRSKHVSASSVKFAKNKLERQLNKKVKIAQATVIGYF